MDCYSELQFHPRLWFHDSKLSCFKAVVLEKYDVEKDKDRIELVVANRRRSLQYDIQASDWDEGQKQLQKCLRHFAKSKSRGYYSLPVTYGIVAIGGYAKFYTVLSR